MRFLTEFLKKIAEKARAKGIRREEQRFGEDTETILSDFEQRFRQSSQKEQREAIQYLYKTSSSEGQDPVTRLIALRAIEIFKKESGIYSQEIEEMERVLGD